MYDEKNLKISRLLVALDMCLTVLTFVVAVRLRESAWFSHYPYESFDFFTHASLLPLILALMGFLLPRAGAYRGLRSDSIWSHCWIVSRSTGITIVALLSFLFVMNVQSVSRIIMFTFLGLNIVTLTGVRMLLRWWYTGKSLKSDEDHLKVLVVGTGNRAIRISEALKKNVAWGIDIIGYIDPDASKTDVSISGAPVLGTLADIDSILKENVVDEVIIAVPRKLIGDVEEIAHTCEEEGVKLRLMVDMFDLKEHKVSLVNLKEIPLLTLESVAQDDIKLIVKRLFDLTLTIFALPVLLPLMAGVALAVRLDSPGSVFFVQKRVGLKKRLFKMYKFRSMYEDSEKRMKEFEHLNEADGPIFKMKNDPRITRVGRFIRKTSLDEFPQFLNVLMGEMSLVGPRPMSIRDVDLFSRGLQRKRFSVRPGLTCIWQISGRSDLPFDKWLELDLKYIENWSLRSDMKILAKTFPAVILGKGAV